MSDTIVATTRHEQVSRTYGGDGFAPLRVSKCSRRRLVQSSKPCDLVLRRHAGSAVIVASTHDDVDACDYCAGHAIRCRKLSRRRRVHLSVDVAVIVDAGLKAPSRKRSARARQGVNGFENAWATYFEACDARRRLFWVVLGVQGRCQMRRHSRHHRQHAEQHSGDLRSSNKAPRRMVCPLVSSSSSMKSLPAKVVACGEAELAKVGECAEQP